MNNWPHDDRQPLNAPGYIKMQWEGKRRGGGRGSGVAAVPSPLPDLAGGEVEATARRQLGSGGLTAREVVPSSPSNDGGGGGDDEAVDIKEGEGGVARSPRPSQTDLAPPVPGAARSEVSELCHILGRFTPALPNRRKTKGEGIRPKPDDEGRGGWCSSPDKGKRGGGASSLRRGEEA
uniref:Uncharacterized protein n=1 Tax=Oryza sativa subsp. japonica TaxID=39947 RepID=Q6Z9K3_ORYSJ|nr:hypothetical protein [Oryza sativa Japonica Group]